MSQKFNPNELYPLADHPSYTERKRFGLGIHDSARDLRAKPTGEKRKPKAGEWYLSGAVIEGYRAPNDLTTPYRIAELVLTETTTTIKTVIVDRKE